MKNLSDWKKWKGKAIGRKGMGMELALLVLFVVFACSTLLVSAAIIGKSSMNDRKDELKERLVLDELARELLSLDSVTESDKEELAKRFGDYAAFTYTYTGTDGVWNTVLASSTNPDIEPEGIVGDEVELAQPSTAVLITDLSGKPLLTAAQKDGKVVLWNYH